MFSLYPAQLEEDSETTQPYDDLNLRTHPLYDAATAERKAVLDANPRLLQYIDDATGSINLPEPNTNVRKPPEGGIANFLDKLGSIESKLTPVTKDSWLDKKFTLIHDTPLTAIARGVATELPYLGRAIKKLGSDSQNITLDEIRDLSLIYGGGGILGSQVARKSGGATLGMFVSPSKAGVKKEVIKKAEKMQKAGASATDIWEETKLVVDDSGNLMKEISDKEFLVNIPAAKEVTKKIFGKEFKTEMLDSQPIRNYILELLGFKTRNERVYPMLYNKTDPKAGTRLAEEWKLKPVSKEVGEYKIGDIMEHPELFKMYPELKDVAFQDQEQNIWSVLGGSTTRGSFHPEKVLTKTPDELGINIFTNEATRITPELLKVKPNLPEDQFKKTALHEIQHYIQEHEGFASGGNVTGTDIGPWVHETAEKKVDDFKDAFVSEITSEPEFAKLFPPSRGENPKAGLWYDRSVDILKVPASEIFETTAYRDREIKKWLEDKYEPWRGVLTSPSLEKALNQDISNTSDMLAKWLYDYKTWDAVPSEVVKKLTLDKKGGKLSASWDELYSPFVEEPDSTRTLLDSFFSKNWEELSKTHRFFSNLVHEKTWDALPDGIIRKGELFHQEFLNKSLETEGTLIKFLDSGLRSFSDLNVGEDIYSRLSGEVVSKVVEARKNLSPEELLTNNPLLEFDKIAPEEERIYPLSLKDYE